MGVKKNLERYYTVFDEENRLLSQSGQVEYLTSMKYIHDFLAGDKQKRILEIGAGTGRYCVELAKEGYPAFVGPSFGKKSKMELAHKGFTTPAVLHAAGVPVSIITDAPVTPLEALPMCAALAVSSGLDEETAWRAITINPATQTGIGDRVGSLEVGKDADIVIWTADPMHTVGAEALMTIVDGKVVYGE